MKAQHWLLSRWRNTVQRDMVPSAFMLWSSVFAHLLILVLVTLALHTIGTRIVPAKYQVARLSSGQASLRSSSQPAQLPLRSVRVNPRRAHARMPERVSKSSGSSGQSLREQAQQETAAIMMSLRFHAIYGFYPGHDYKLAVQTVGEIPAISAEQLPPHFQQYVIIEVTIDTGGQVADARVVAGIVDPPIEMTLLSAIRQFKYTPALRDGIAIPSQKDIVIHIPT